MFVTCKTRGGKSDVLGNGSKDVPVNPSNLQVETGGVDLKYFLVTFVIYIYIHSDTFNPPDLFFST